MARLRQSFITSLQGMTTNMFPDLIEVNPMVQVEDGYGTTIQAYPHSGKFYRGSLQMIIRVPGVNDQADTVTIIGNFVIKIQADAIVPQKSQLVVNGGDVYQTENVYADRNDRLAISIYCYRLK